MEIKKQSIAFNVLSNIQPVNPVDLIMNTLNENFEKGLIDELETEQAFEQLDSLIEKGMGGHKYFKREGTPGSYKYYYTEAEYKEAKDGKEESDSKDSKSYKITNALVEYLDEHKEKVSPELIDQYAKEVGIIFSKEEKGDLIKQYNKLKGKNENGVHLGYLSLSKKASYIRKPEVGKTLNKLKSPSLEISTKEEKDYIKSLPEFKLNKVSSNNPNSTTENYIAIDDKGDKYLVDTQGYDYMRYIIKIKM